MICKLFGCNFVDVKLEQPIRGLQKTKYIFYKECTRCKAKTDLNSHIK